MSNRHISIWAVVFQIHTGAGKRSNGNSLDTVLKIDIFDEKVAVKFRASHLGHASWDEVAGEKCRFSGDHEGFHEETHRFGAYKTNWVGGNLVCARAPVD